jgi:branched-chain amino acid aminotransferase
MELDWGHIGFGYRKTDYNVRYHYKDGKWGSPEISSSEYINLHMSATCLHYGQEAFEGMKAYKGKDGNVRIFRWKDNAERMRSSSKGILMAQVPEELFHEAIITAIRNNSNYIPPYGSGASLYIRPVLIGTDPEIGVKPSKEYLFIVFVMPVGPYFKDGFKPVDIMICREYDRAAPLGTGHIKVGGNYAASLISMTKAHELGYATVMYLDAKEKKYIDECGPANFYGIKENTYVTPDSHSVLPSITNKSLQTLAMDMGLKIEKRHVPVEELAEFDEAGTCGTAAVLTPIGKVVDIEKNITYTISKDGKPGPISTKLYEQLVSIQYGEISDNYGWTEIVDLS